MFLEKYVTMTLRYHKKDVFMSLKQGGMSLDAYETMFHACQDMLQCL